jgi:hypothetical protein
LFSKGFEPECLTSNPTTSPYGARLSQPHPLASTRCGRRGQYRKDCLIEQCGRDVRILDWLDELTADCMRKRAASKSDHCHARCADLLAVV